MNKRLNIIAVTLGVFSSNISIADEDSRQLVELPEMMQQHMMSNMRDHLVAMNEILIDMANGQLEQAAEVAESRLGMSSLEAHGEVIWPSSCRKACGRLVQVCIGPQAVLH